MGLTREKRREVSRSYFNLENFAEHQFRSYNEFIESGIQKVIDEHDRIEIEYGEDENEPDEEVYVDLGKIRVNSPKQKESDGGQSLMIPNEARMRGLDYTGSIYLGMSIVKGGEVIDAREMYIGDMPVMVNSDLCNLQLFDEEDLPALGEDPVDPGGYFIVNGTEKTISTFEDLAQNKMMVDSTGETAAVKIFSQNGGYRAMTRVHRTKRRDLKVDFPYANSSVPVVDMMRFLGLETDQEVVEKTTSDPKYAKHMMENIQETESSNSEDALEIIADYIGEDYGDKLDYAENVVDRYFLPHIQRENTQLERIEKALLLAKMTKRCLMAFEGDVDETDKDHYKMKRLRVAGDLLENLFRTSIRAFDKDITYQLKKARRRGRELDLNTIVRPGKLSNKLTKSVATGKFGNRTGTTQFVDRMNYMSVMSSLMEVKSPLSEAGPHFEARALHPTQWGRICPSETPEGPKCGLKQKLSQMTEISKDTPEDEVENFLLEETGVQRIDKQKEKIEEMEDVPRAT